MEKVESLARRLQSQASTIESANDWAPCASCRQDWQPNRLNTDKICPICEAQATETRARLLLALGGERALDMRFDTFRQSSHNQEAYALIDKFNPQASSLYLHGTCGTGKTHLAIATARRAIEQKLGVEYTQPSRILRRMRGRTGDEEQGEINRLVKLSVLVLDDLGAEKHTDFAIQILYEIIDGRYMNKQHGLLVTSNLSLADLADKLGDDRIPSRLAEMCQVVRVNGPDHRVKA